MRTIRDWIRDKLVGVSLCEIIDNYKTYSGRNNTGRITRARLEVIPSTKGDYRPGLCVSIQQDDGRWRERLGVMRWRMTCPVTERYLACVATTNLKYKGWKSSPKEMIGFLRVGVSGAVFLMANNDRIEIATPPFPTEPPTHLRALAAGANGFLCETQTPNQDYEVWQSWTREVSEVTDHLRQRIELAGIRVDPADYQTDRAAVCGICGKHAAQDRPEAAWRKVGTIFFCAKCNTTRGRS